MVAHKDNQDETSEVNGLSAANLTLEQARDLAIRTGEEIRGSYARAYRRIEVHNGTLQRGTKWLPPYSGLFTRNVMRTTSSAR